MNLLEQITTKRKELDRLIARQKTNQGKVARRWRGKFVEMNLDGVYINPKILPFGLKEIEKYDIEYLTDVPKEFREWIWENPGISYTPKKCFCMICGSTETTSWLQMGIAPRFATCAKHGDFLHLNSNLRKKNHASKTKRK